MGNMWQAIKFVEGQTVGDFVKQFDNFLDKEALIHWSCMGGIFKTALSNPNKDGSVEAHLPLLVKR